MVIDCRCIILYLFVVYCLVDVSGCWFSLFLLLYFVMSGYAIPCSFGKFKHTVESHSKMLHHLSIWWKNASLEIIYVYLLILLCSCHGLSQRFLFPTGLWHKKTAFFLITLILFFFLSSPILYDSLHLVHVVLFSKWYMCAMINRENCQHGIYEKVTNILESITHITRLMPRCIFYMKYYMNNNKLQCSIFFYIQKTVKYVIT